MEEKVNKFESFLTIAGKDAEAIFADIFTPANVAISETAVGFLLPQVSVIFDLVANTALIVEQKFAALGKQNGTGAQKFAQVLAIVQSTVLSIFASNKITGDITAIINAVVAFLNAFGPAGSVVPATV